MSITPINVGGQQYSVEVAQEGDVKTVDQAAIKSAVTDITPELLDQVERGLLKDGISIKLPDGMVVSSEEQLDALNRLQNLSSSDVLVDSMELMKVFQQCNMLMRQTAREQRASELSAQVASLNSAAEEMKSAADKRLAAGIAQGVMGIIGGCVQVVGGAVQIGQAARAFQASNEGAKSQNLADVHKLRADKLEIKGDLSGSRGAAGQSSLYAKTAAEQNALATQLSAKATASGQIGQGLSALASSSGGLASSALNHAADIDEVDKTKLETEAKVHETNVQHANEIMQNTLEIIQDMKDKLAAMQQAQNETNRGIARNI